LDHTGARRNRIRSRARKSLVFVAGTVSPNFAATSRSDRPETEYSANTSRRCFGSFATASETARAISWRQAAFSGLGAGQVRTSCTWAPRMSSSVNHANRFPGSRSCMRQQFTTMRVIQVLKQASPRNLWRCRKADKYATCTASCDSASERSIPRARRREAG